MWKKQITLRGVSAGRWLSCLLLGWMAALSPAGEKAGGSAEEKIPLRGPVCFRPAVPVSGQKHYVIEWPCGHQEPAQADDDGRIWVWTDLTTSPTRLAMALRETTVAPPEHVTVSPQGEDRIGVSLGGRPFTVFNTAPGEPKPFLWPVIGPTGDAVTRAYPMAEVEGEKRDHIHHRSIWSAWGDVRTTDPSRPGSNYWHQAKNPADQDRQIVRRIARTVSGPVFGRIEAHIDWVNRTGRREFTEIRTYTFLGDDNRRVIDVGIRYRFEDMDVIFADTKEAGILALRVASSMDEKGPGAGVITNAAGATGMKGCWGIPSPWCDYTGPVNGRTTGIAVLDAPSNPGHPPRWHVRDYGLFSVNPFSVRDFPGGQGRDGSRTFRKGEEVSFDYRVVIHRGDVRAAGIADFYTAYVRDLGVPATAPAAGG